MKIEEVRVPGYEKVIKATDPSAKLHCFIAIHSTELGPSLGGARIKCYPNEKEALEDALRLAKAMTYKSAVARDGLGGGKSVIIASQEDKNEKLLLAFGEVVDSLKGKYIVAEDVGSNLADMEIIRRSTPYVAALPHVKSSGDPSRFTAWGVFRGIQAAAKSIWGTTSLRRRIIAIQGLGSVGAKLANILFWEGASLILSDIDQNRVKEAVALYGAAVVNTEDYYRTQCDILAPCALGGGITPESILHLGCTVIAGAANNQLSEAACGELLMQRNILYAPDYVINSGGIINAAEEFDLKGYNPVVSRDKVNHIFDILKELFRKARKEKKPTNIVADELAEYNLRHGIGRRTVPIVW